MATIGTHYVNAALKGAIAQGLDRESLLLEAGISPSLVRNASGRVSDTQMARLVRTIWRNLEDEFMGFTRQPAANGLFALMTEVAHQADTLGGMLGKGLHFYNLVTRDIAMALDTGNDDGLARLCVRFAHPQLDPDHFYREFWLVIWHRFASWYIGETVHLTAVHLTCPEPSHRHELRYVFPCPINFEQTDNRLIFNAGYLRKPLVRSEGELKEFLRRSPADLMTIPGEDKSLSSQLRRKLTCRLPGKLPDIASLSRELGMTPQTLHNRLKREGIGYQDIKDEVRLDFAVDKLLNDKMKIEQIAGLLGFTEARSFTRAFKHWTGMSPRQFTRHSQK